MSMLIIDPTMMTICIVGSIANLIAFCTFGRMGVKNSSTTLLRALAFVDSWFLLTYFCQHVASLISFIININAPRYIHSNLNTVLRYVLDKVFPFARTATIWTPILLGIHRYIVVCKPFSAARMCTVANARKHFVCVHAFSLIINFPGLFEVGIRQSSTPENTTYFK